MTQPSAQWIAGIAGLVLVLAGAALAAVVIGGPGLDGSAPDAGSTVPMSSGLENGTEPPSAGAGATPTSQRAGSVQTAPEPTPSAIEQEPFWRTKQREAEARLLGADGGSGGVGAIAVIAFDPTREAAAAAAARPAIQTPTVATGPTTRAVSQGGATPLTGVWAGTATELSAYLLRNESAPRFTVPTETLAGYYVKYAAEVGLRADVLWAQMLHETGFGAYGGSVGPGQNNYAGIGATGGGAPGVSFASAEAGVMAHVAHMAAYVFTAAPAPWANSTTDPRYDMVAPRGVARVLSDLDGRWAVPGDGYGVAIENHVRAINGS
ncbi:MAG: glucosaminidase domain-containing protein [Thermoleophilia bacterium]